LEPWESKETATCKRGLNTTRSSGFIKLPVFRMKLCNL
jgi:hypothetical protein